MTGAGDEDHIEEQGSHHRRLGSEHGLREGLGIDRHDRSEDPDHVQDDEHSRKRSEANQTTLHSLYSVTVGYGWRECGEV